MAKPKIIKLDSIVRGDTPLISVPITVNGTPFDLTGWDAKITITANPTPTDNTDAIVDKEACTVDENTVSYQLATTVTEGLAPGTTYYGDIELSKSPATTNTFTPLRFSFQVVTDFGV